MKPLDSEGMCFSISTLPLYHMFLSFAGYGLTQKKMTILGIFIHNLWGYSLEVQMHRTLVNAGQQSLTVAHRQLPQDRSTEIHLISQALEDQLVSQAAWEAAQHEPAKKNILHSSLYSIVLLIDVTRVQWQPALWLVMWEGAYASS